MSDILHQLQWCGRAVGPWTMTQIREALVSGEIHSLYQIHVTGQWLVLRDYLEALDASELERRANHLGAQVRQKIAEQVEHLQLIERKRHGFRGSVIKPNAFTKAPPVFIKTSSGVPCMNKDELPTLFLDAAPTCWLAVIAFVVSCASFVPYLNLVSWLPSIVLGHLSLRQIQRQPYLEGHGLAIGALIIGYATLILAIVTALFSPDLFYRIFPVGDT